MMRQKKIKAGGVESSNSVEAHRGWLELWNTNVPGKVKVHVWRLLKNGLGLGAELQRRKIKEEVMCVACGWEETALHRFWQCPHSQFLWKTVGDLTGTRTPLPPANVHNQRDMLNWMLEWFSSAQNEEIEVTLMVIYQAWLARNAARESLIEDPACIARRAVGLLEEWRNVQEPKPAKMPTPREHWLAPEAGWTKINTDGTMLKNSDKGGGGVVARDHDGRFLAGSCHFFTSLLDPEDAELRACRAGIEMARRLQVQQVILETDNASVVAKLGCEAKDRSIHGPLVEEIKNELRMLVNYKVKWARR
jgi:hypothetical protein